MLLSLFIEHFMATLRLKIETNNKELDTVNECLTVLSGTIITIKDNFLFVSRLGKPGAVYDLDPSDTVTVEFTN